MKTKLLIILFAFLSACVSSRIESVMNSWLGHDSNELKLEWGPPTYTVEYDNVVAWVYQFARNGAQIPGIMTADRYGNIYYTAPQQYQYTVTRTFFIDRSTNKVVSWKSKGL